MNPPDITKLCNINEDNTVDVTYGCAIQVCSQLLFLFSLLTFSFNYIEICDSYRDRGTQTSTNTCTRNAGASIIIKAASHTAM